MVRMDQTALVSAYSAQNVRGVSLYRRRCLVTLFA